MFKGQKLISTAIILGITLFLSLDSPFMGKPAAAKENQQQANRGMPVRRVGGGARGGIAQASWQDFLPLVAVMPDRIIPTSVASPTLVFYIPTTKDNVTMEFVLRNQDDELVCERTFTSEQREGLFSFSLADVPNCPELQIGQNYRWYFSIINDPLDRSHDKVAEGWWTRISLAPTVEAQLYTSSPLAQVAFYQENGLWHEAVATLMQLRNDDPDNLELAQQWQELVRSFGFEAEYENVLARGGSL
jgi:hypothetical protein